MPYSILLNLPWSLRPARFLSLSFEQWMESADTLRYILMTQTWAQIRFCATNVLCVCVCVAFIWIQLIHLKCATVVIHLSFFIYIVVFAPKKKKKLQEFREQKSANRSGNNCRTWIAQNEIAFVLFCACQESQEGKRKKRVPVHANRQTKKTKNITRKKWIPEMIRLPWE